MGIFILYPTFAKGRVNKLDIKLRPYQQECLDIIESKGKGRYIVQMATGLGKTVVFTHIPRQGRMLLLSHREELVRQPLKYFDCSTGVEMAGESSHGEEVVSASVQTMIHRLDRFGAEDFNTIIVDECFPSSTLVDGKQIVELKEGDVVNSYNHITDKIEKKKIIHIFKRKPSAMMKVILSNGQSIVCTPNHPVWVEGKGYTAACSLKEDDHVIRMHIIPDLLQGRYCVTNSDDCNRSRRRFSFCYRKTNARQEKRCFFEKIRVERIEVYEQTSDGTFGGMCPDGYVYNIEVEDNHNYFAEGVLVHNCHHAAAKSYKEVIGHFKPRMLLGFTATPNRADGARLNDVFDEIIFKRDLRWGIQNGYLCDILCKRVDIGYDLTAVHSRMGDYAPGELEKAMDGTADAVAQCYKEHAKGATLIFAVSVDQCEEIAKRIDGAEVITGQTKNRAEIIKRFTAREIPCLVNCMVFTEGTDMPLVETVIIARPTQSDSLYAQMVGRGLRLHPEKSILTLIDCVGVTGKASLCTAPSLLGIDVEKVPRKKRNDLEGMLFELPEKAEMLSDTPSSWIRNVTIVDLWAKNMKYQLHNVNWYQLPDGTMLCNLPDKQVLEIPPADELGRTEFMGQIMDMQEAFDRAFELLQQKHSDSKAIWDKQIAKKWTEQPATQAQIDFVKRVAKKHLDDIDFDTLTKGQAGMIITRMKGGKHSVRGQRTSRRH